MNRKKMRLIVLILILGILAVWIGRLSWLNQKYPLPNIIKYQRGEFVELGSDRIDTQSMEDYSVRVNQSRIWDYSDFLENYNIDPSAVEPEKRPMPERLYEVQVTLKHKSEPESGILLMDWGIQSVDLYCSLQPELFLAVNPNIQSLAIRLKENSEISINFVYGLWEDKFTKHEWENLSEYPMWLTVTLYPTKKMINILPE